MVYPTPDIRRNPYPNFGPGGYQPSYDSLHNDSSSLFSIAEQTYRNWAPIREESAKWDALIFNVMSRGSGSSSGPSSNNGAGPTDNTAAYFDKLIYIKNGKVQKTAEMERLQKLEKEIAEAEQKEKEEKDAAKKKELTKKIRTLKAEYRKLERQIGSKRAAQGGTEFKFYSNLSDEELMQIHKDNVEIETAKTTIKEKEASLVARKRGIIKQLQAIGARINDDISVPFNEETAKRLRESMERAGKDSALVDDILSPEVIAEIEGLSSEISTLKLDLTKKIQALNECVKAAAKDGTSVDFEHVRAADERRKEEARAAGARTKADNDTAKAMEKAAGIIKTKGKDLQPADVSEIMTQVKQSLPTDYAHTQELESAIRFMVNQMSGKGTAALATIDFWNNLAGDADVRDHSGKEFSKLSMVERLYDQIVGDGKFREQANSQTTGTKGIPLSVNAKLIGYIGVSDAYNAYGLNHALNNSTGYTTLEITVKTLIDRVNKETLTKQQLTDIKVSVEKITQPSADKHKTTLINLINQKIEDIGNADPADPAASKGSDPKPNSTVNQPKDLLTSYKSIIGVSDGDAKAIDDVIAGAIKEAGDKANWQEKAAKVLEKLTPQLETAVKEDMSSPKANYITLQMFIYTVIKEKGFDKDVPKSLVDILADPSIKPNGKFDLTKVKNALEKKFNIKINI